MTAFDKTKPETCSLCGKPLALCQCDDPIAFRIPVASPDCALQGAAAKVWGSLEYANAALDGIAENAAYTTTQQTQEEVRHIAAYLRKAQALLPKPEEFCPNCGETLDDCACYPLLSVAVA
jgi:hypothetical protein